MDFRTAARGVPPRTWAVVAAVAGFAALLEYVFSDGWTVTDFIWAGTRNILVAGGAVMLAETIRPMLTGHGILMNKDEQLPCPGVALDRGHEWLADHLSANEDVWPLDSDVAEATFIRLDELRWLLGQYVVNGTRSRRLVELPQLLASTVGDARPHPEWTHGAIGDVRVAAADLLQRMIDTNLVTADWLTTQRVALPDPAYLDSNALLGRYEDIQIMPGSVSGDPLYLLVCHVHDMLETVEGFGDVEHPVLDILESQLSPVLTTVKGELAAAQAFNAALLSLSNRPHSADAT